jgi:hypothetical protein
MIALESETLSVLLPATDPPETMLIASLVQFGGHVAEYMESLEEEDDEVPRDLLQSSTCHADFLCSDSRSSSPNTSPMISAPRTWRTSTLRRTSSTQDICECSNMLRALIRSSCLAISAHRRSSATSLDHLQPLQIERPGIVVA